MNLPAFQIRVGDMIDLENDDYADPRHEPRMASNYWIVSNVNDEGPCIAITFDGLDQIGFPRNHLLSLIKE